MKKLLIQCSKTLSLFIGYITNDGNDDDEETNVETDSDNDENNSDNVEEEEVLQMSAREIKRKSEEMRAFFINHFV